MGTQQFYSPLKSSVDEISRLTNGITREVAEISTMVDDLKNSDIGNLNLQVAGLGWWGKYKRETIQKQNPVFTTPFVDISGKQGLFQLIVRSGSSGRFITKFKIEIDGLVYDNMTSGMVSLSGNSISHALYNIPTALTCGGTYNSKKWYETQYYDSSTSLTVYMPTLGFQYLSFKNSLKIWIETSDTAGSGNVYCDLLTIDN